MILRLAAALALLLGGVALLGYLHVLGKGPFAPLEMRHLRAMKDRLDPPQTIVPVTFADFDSLPHGWSVAEYSALEARGVSLEGWVQHVMRSSDGDLHLEIAVDSVGPDGPMRAYVTGEITPGWRRGSRGWSYENLAAEFRAPRSGSGAPFEQGTRRARLSGWLTYDFQYDGIPSRDARIYSAPRLTGWEIHPVTRIEVWDETSGRWREVTR